MDFMREILGTPVPRVLSWSADAQNNGVGAEYIVMEKVGGKTLTAHWPSVTDGGLVAELIESLNKLEKSWESVTFSQMGSLYYKADVSPELRSRPLFGDDVVLDDKLQAATERYRIGPIADRQWYRGERINMPLDFGPCEYSQLAVLLVPSHLLRM